MINLISKIGFLWILILFGLSEPCVAMAKDSVVEQWLNTVRGKRWVTAMLDSGRSADGKRALGRIVLKQGMNERIVYEADATEVTVGWPFVSPDGTKVAFRLREKADGVEREAIYFMETQGTSYRKLVEISPDLATRPPDMLGLRLAWSHNNKKILFGAMLANSVVGPKTRKFGEWGPNKLMTVDVTSGEAIEQLPNIGTRVLGSGIGGPIITSQAWSPNNQRFVFMNDAGNFAIFKMDTREVTELGPGKNPTWSPDGRWIAVQKPGGPQSRGDGDYMIVSAEPPHREELLLRNRSTYAGLGFYGEALWLPDPRFLVVFHYPGEQGFAHVLDRETSALGKLPPGFWGRSWGGKK
jgi:Tol biopolymer transport system component